MFSEHTAKKIGGIAYQSLLEELYTTPKPGLVDLFSNGAHTDMDVSTFERSALALHPYFTQMAEAGLTFNGTEPALFDRIRPIGIEAERAMLQATGGVNTHKGLIFTLGIYCAAAGRCIRNDALDAASVRMVQQQMTYDAMVSELTQIMQKQAATKGEHNLQKFGMGGIRETIKSGCPEVWDLALPVLGEELALGSSMQKAKLQTLMVLMEVMEDSNVVGRHDPEMLQYVQDRAQWFLSAGGVHAPNYLSRLYAMDELFIHYHVSPGGSADMLALTIFLHLLLDPHQGINR